MPFFCLGLLFALLVNAHSRPTVPALAARPTSSTSVCLWVHVSISMCLTLEHPHTHLLTHPCYPPCSETYKFHERVQLDSITQNELGDPEEVAHVSLGLGVGLGE